MRSANVLASGCVAGLLLICRSSWAQGVPQSFTLTGTLRDFPSESSHPDFGAFPPATPGAKSAKNISTTLDTDQKPVYVGQGKKVTDEWQCANGHIIGWCQPPMPGDVPGVLTVDDDGGITNGVTFSQWFRDVPGVNMSRLWPITLEKDNVDGGDDDGGGGNDNPIWTYENENFNPIDEQLFGNGPDEHNFYFTYEIAASFTYSAATDQFFWYNGSDDAWVFVNDQLVIDHGGVAADREQRIDFNRLGLSEGETYQLRLFMAERVQPQTQLHIKTNVVLTSVNSDSIFAVFD